MCGRYVAARATADLVALFDVAETGDGLPGPAWNIKPTNPVPVVLESAKGGDIPVRRLEPARWSLTPSYSKELKTKFAFLQRPFRDGGREGHVPGLGQDQARHSAGRRLF